MALETADDNCVIKIEKLVKEYGSKKVLDNICVNVKKGEIMGFLGPNGAGKSTTMNILTGYLSLTSGKAMVDGFDIVKQPNEVKKRIGYLPELPPLYFDMTVSEYLNFVYGLKKVKLNKEEHIAKILDEVKLTDVKNRLIKNLSKGYKQRVGLAQALVGDPEVLILDEPTVGLDPKQIIEIRNVIKSLGKDRTVILSTHILQEVTAVCDRVTIINQGRIVAEDTMANLSDKIGGNNRFEIRVDQNRESAEGIISEIPNIKSFTYDGEKEENTSDFVIEFEEENDMRAELFRAFAKADIPLIGIKSLNMTLEEVFIKVTSRNESAEEGNK